MFTGIITDIGTIRRVARRGDLRVEIACGYDLGGVDLGASIACSGVCLTVVEKGPDWFAVDLSGESLARTAPRWSEGARINLERALRVGDELGGHIVTGHVDAVGTIEERREIGGSIWLAVVAGRDVAPYVAGKGSITVDGVSLTVNELLRDMPGSGEVAFALNIIPHTAAVTTLSGLGRGDAVNLEIDVLARYLGRMQQLRATAGAA